MVYLEIGSIIEFSGFGWVKFDEEWIPREFQNHLGKFRSRTARDRNIILVEDPCGVWYKFNLNEQCEITKIK